MSTYSNQAKVDYILAGQPMSNTSNAVVCFDVTGTFNVVKTQKYTELLPESIQVYTVVLTNSTGATLSNVTFSDIIPAGLKYVLNSLTVDSSPTVPTVSGNTISVTLASFANGTSRTISFQVIHG